MPRITITLEDATDEHGRPVCRCTSKMDREGMALDAPATPAQLHAATVRLLGELGVIERLVTLVESKIQFDSLTGYLKAVGALDDAGNLDLGSARPSGHADVVDLEVVDGVATPSA